MNQQTAKNLRRQLSNFVDNQDQSKFKSEFRELKKAFNSLSWKERTRVLAGFQFSPS